MNKNIQEATNNSEIQNILSAIYNATGINLDEIAKKTRKRYLFYLRLILVKHCNDAGLTRRDILFIIRRDKSMILYYEKKYNDEICYNSEFRRIVQEVDKHLKEQIPA